MDTLTRCRWRSSKGPALGGISTHFSLSRVRPRVPVEQGCLFRQAVLTQCLVEELKGINLPMQSSRRADGQMKRKPCDCYSQGRCEEGSTKP